MCEGVPYNEDGDRCCFSRASAPKQSDTIMGYCRLPEINLICVRFELQEEFTKEYDVLSTSFDYIIDCKRIGPFPSVHRNDFRDTGLMNPIFFGELFLRPSLTVEFSDLLYF